LSEVVDKSAQNHKADGVLKEILNIFKDFEGNYNYVEKVCILLSKCLSRKLPLFDELAKDRYPLPYVKND